MKRFEVAAALLTALLATCVLFPGLSSVGVLDSHEALDRIVLSEHEGGFDVLTPTVANEPWFDRPILAYAPEYVAYRHLHRSLPASRAIRAGLMAALVLLTATIGATCFGARAGWLAAGVLATMLGGPLAARADGGQVLASVFAWLGLAGLAPDALRTEPVAPRDLGGDLRRFGAYLAFGLALLAGGPLSALWPFTGLVGWTVLSRSAHGLRALRPLAGLVIAASVALPWYGAELAFFGPAFLRAAPAMPYAANTPGPWYAGLLFTFVFFVVAAFPWSPFVTAAIGDETMRLRVARMLRRSGAPEPRERWLGHRAPALWIVLLVAACIPIALWPSPPLTAALPALPAAALLAGRFLERIVAREPGTERTLGAATRGLAFLGTVLSLLLASLSARVPEAAPELRALGATLLVTAWAPLLATLLGRWREAAVLFALPVALGAPYAHVRLVPALEPWLNTRRVAEAMNTHAPPLAPLAVLEEAPPSLRLLLRRNLIVAPSAARDPAPWRAVTGETWLAFRPSREREVARVAPAALEIVLRTPTLSLARVRAPVAPIPRTDTTSAPPR